MKLSYIIKVVSNLWNARAEWISWCKECQSLGTTTSYTLPSIEPLIGAMVHVSGWGLMILGNFTWDCVPPSQWGELHSSCSTGTGIVHQLKMLMKANNGLRVMTKSYSGSAPVEGILCQCTRSQNWCEALCTTHSSASRKIGTCWHRGGYL